MTYPVLSRTAAYLGTLCLFAALFSLLSVGQVLAADTQTEPAISGPSQADIILLIIFVSGALVFSFICSVAEAVLLSITPSFIEKLRVDQPERANSLKALRQDNVDRSLAAILTVNTIAHTVGAIASGAQATVVFGSAWIGLFSGIMTLAILFLSEIIPKTIGAVYWPNLVGPTMVFIRISIKLLYPLIIISEALTKLIARGKSVHPVGKDELLAMTNLGERSGEIEKHEAHIVRNLIHFGSLTAEDIMTPRTVVAAFQEGKTVSWAASEMSKHPFSRFPVYGKDIDDVVGLVLRDEILAMEAADDGNKTLNTVKTDMQHIEAETALPELLELFLTSRKHIALVVDTYGGTKGIVSLEDVIEALLGMEIMDEMDNVEDMRQHARKQWLERATKLGIDPD